MPNLEEAIQAVEALREVKPEDPCWVSFSCKNESTLWDGTSIEEATKQVCKFQNIFAVGINCTPPRFVEQLLSKMKNVTDKKLLTYPNKGGQWDSDKKEWIEGTEQTDQEFAEIA